LGLLTRGDGTASRPLPALILFARAPVLGGVKTRLAGYIGAAPALRLYRAFLQDAARIYGSGPWTPVLAADPDPDDASLASLFPPPWRRERQGAGDLGNRLTEAFRREFGAGAPAAVAVGSDHPALGRAPVAEALARVLDGSAAAAVPAEDGGYCAIAFSAGAPYEEAFRDIPWSTPDVLARTSERLALLGAPFHVLGHSYDVDRPEDLDRLRADLAERKSAVGAASPDFPTETARVVEAISPGGRP
jgi:rSAM/selenodomain-associated transferase 1